MAAVAEPLLMTVARSMAADRSITDAVLIFRAWHDRFMGSS